LPDPKKPCFNTSALEASFYKIPGLSEYFILGSDDYFVCRPVKQGYFFNDNGVPIYSVRYGELGKSPKFFFEIAQAYSAICKEYPKKNKVLNYTHNFTAMRKSH
jgi:hypothetical protein